MKELNNKELMNIDGGADSITATFLTAVGKLISIIMDVGRNLGSSIKRIYDNNMCQY